MPVPTPFARSGQYSDQPSMRVSDIERQRAVDELRRHCAAGRLDVDEYAQRIEQVLSATTLEEIDRVLADLPMVRIADPAGTAAGHAAGAIGSTDDSSEIAARHLSTRMSATVVVLLTVVVVVAAVLLATLASWAWAAVLVAGWVLGLAQARLSRRRS
jgi:hypothetical protein